MTCLTNDSIERRGYSESYDNILCVRNSSVLFCVNAIPAFFVSVLCVCDMCLSGMHCVIVVRFAIIRHFLLGHDALPLAADGVRSCNRHGEYVCKCAQYGEVHVRNISADLSESFVNLVFPLPTHAVPDASRRGARVAIHCICVRKRRRGADCEGAFFFCVVV